MNQRTWDILKFIKASTRERGFPPTIREIGDEFGISSTNGVRYHLALLEKQGHVKRNRRLSRGIEAAEAAGAQHGIPVLGRVAAGQPLLAQESLEGHLVIDDMFGSAKGLFALRVKGDSMVDAGVLEGDYVVVRGQERADTGDMVVGLIGDEATVKYYRPRNGVVELVPANKNYQPIRVDGGDEFRILGVVRGVLRTVGR
jgi:repressor LexA